MTNQLNETTPRQAARIAGVGYVVLFVLAIFANFFVRTGLVVMDDAAATFANVAESELLFRTGLVSFVVIFIVDIVVAWALYILFRPVSRQLSLLTAWFRIVYTVFLGVAAIFFFVVLGLISGASYLNAFGPHQLDAQVMLALEAFNYTWLIGLACFGIHLILVGSMMLASGRAPKLLGVVLAVAGAAYLIDTIAYSLLSNYADYAGVFLAIVAIPSIIAELAFTMWLLTQGRKGSGADTSDLAGSRSAVAA